MNKSKNFINCPVCSYLNKESILTINNLPLGNLGLTKSADKSLSAISSDMQITVCSKCSHVYNNSAVNLNKLYVNSENTTWYESVNWLKYCIEISENIINKYKIRSKSVLEIGSGSGAFLKSFSNLNKCTAYDPTASKDSDNYLNVDLIKGLFDFDNDRKSFKYDVIIMRHVVEHLINAEKNLSSLIRNGVIDKNGLLILEVPNAEKTLSEAKLTDFVHEHISYFTKESLKNCLLGSGYLVLDMYTVFDDSNLIAISKPIYKSIKQDLIVNKVEISRNSNFLKSISFVELSIIKEFKIIKNRFSKILIWGAGGRGSVFINLIKNHNMIDDNVFVTDSDKSKYKYYVSGTTKIIQSPNELIDKVDCVIITTYLGEKDILKEINELLLPVDLTPKLFVLHKNGLKERKI